MKEKLLFLLHRLIGSDIQNYYSDFFKVYNENIYGLKTERIKKLILYAQENVEFYRTRYPSNKCKQLQDFPVLDKLTLKRNFNALKSDSLLNANSSRFGWKEVQTGGSSGEPTTVIHTKIFRDYGRASRFFSQHLSGFPIPKGFIMLWGNMKEINNMDESVERKLLNYLLNNKKTLNAFRMTEKRMDEYIHYINDSKVEHLMAYVDSAYALTLYAKKKNIRLRKLKSIMGCAGTITPGMRSLLEEDLCVKLHNKYGSRDCSDIACECIEGNIHIYENHVVAEIADDNGNMVSDGGVGKILITPLHNFDFPMIRYEIGDVGSISHKRCRCGITGKVFESIQGRSYEMLTDESGNYVTPIYIRHLIGVVHNQQGIINRFQLIQYSPNGYNLKLEISIEHQNNDKLDEIRQLITNDLIKVLGNTAKLQIEIVDRIFENENGKFSYIINEMLK